ncbi:alanine racemase [Uliginosibacterium aquaticum]|uniref:Alanine racemase n=1 Tax=Uliginosibacterium aquaticum TaxID=2731212 RepID=A0ABX2IJA7_9RHOO|nr:alanine racemase [Uliginosibacterium aquaticum]NSL56825.1 alanine racemase [Uliginosibacterium aquaticum]
MTRPILARIDTAAFRHNYLVAKRHAGAARAWAVVKANAYGHGLLPCAEAVRDVADGFALLEISEALGLRAAGFTQPILMLEGFFAEDDLRLAAAHDISVVIHSQAQLALLELLELERPLNVGLKFNTGMNRLGFLPQQAPALLARLRASGKVGQITLMTHFANADDTGIAAQLACFEGIAADSGLPCSVANSAALLRFPQAQRDWVRPGIMLYGGSPMPDLNTAAALGLRPVMSLASRIIGVQSLQPGESVGYGSLFRAERPTRVGVVACGYADGYPRHAPSGTPILVNGQRSRTLGRVSMDMLACELTDLAADVGSSVTLWGEGLAADEVASAAGTVSYELFCALAPRVPVVLG